MTEPRENASIGLGPGWRSAWAISSTGLSRIRSLLRGHEHGHLCAQGPFARHCERARDPSKGGAPARSAPAAPSDLPAIVAGQAHPVLQRPLPTLLGSLLELDEFGGRGTMWRSGLAHAVGVPDLSAAHGFRGQCHCKRAYKYKIIPDCK